MSRARRIIRWGFLAWAVFAMSYLATGFRTVGVEDALLRDAPGVRVVETDEVLAFEPVTDTSRTAVLFFCGSGVHAHAYAPLLRPIAAAGTPVYVVRLPWRFAPLASHKKEAIARAQGVVAAHADVAHWVVTGHSLGSVLAVRSAAEGALPVAALVLLGTTHPRDHDLSQSPIPVTKVLGTRDGVAPLARAEENRSRLPSDARWIEIDGGTHVQFAHYARQLFDGEPAIARDAQQAIARDEIMRAVQLVR